MAGKEAVELPVVCVGNCFYPLRRVDVVSLQILILCLLFSSLCGFIAHLPLWFLFAACHSSRLTVQYLDEAKHYLALPAVDSLA